MTPPVRYRLDSVSNGTDDKADAPMVEPDAELTRTPSEDMDAAEDAAQGIVARKRTKRATRIRTRRNR